MFLGGHSRIGSTGELSLIGKALALEQTCSCGASLRTCEAWRRVFDLMRLHGADWPDRPYSLRLWDQLAWGKVDRRQQTAGFTWGVRWRRAWMTARAWLPTHLANAVPMPAVLLKARDNKMALYDAIAEAWDCDVVVDSSKSFHEAVELAQRWPERVRLLVVTRDGRGVYHSRRTTGRPRAESVKGWRQYYRRALPLIEDRIPAAQCMRIRYEDLASDPAIVGKSICDFLGVPFEPGMLDLGRATRHLVNGNQTRFSAGQGIRLDERWRSELGGDELAYFLAHGGELNRQLGYQEACAAPREVGA